MFYVIISAKERFENAAERILTDCKQANVDASIILIEKFTTVGPFFKDKVFFLTNDHSVSEWSKKLSDEGAYVINEDFLRGERSKFYVQKTLKGAGVLVPEHADIHDLRSLRSACLVLKFPIFLKSMEHVHNVFNGKNEADIVKFWLATDKSHKWYLEESIEGERMVLEKYYCIFGKYFNMHDKELTADIVNILNLISKILKLNVFSVDVVFDGINYYCIDVNPAPALFRSAFARKYFVGTLEN